MVDGSTVSPEEAGIVQEETAEDVVFLEEQRKADKEALLKVLPEDVRKTVTALADNLTMNLGNYMLRPASDPEVLDLTRNLLSGLSGSLNYGETGKSIPGVRLEQMKAKLTEATKIVSPNPS